MLDKRDWYAAGLEHIWLPYAQMKTAPAPLPVVRTQGTRIHLADGRELDRRHRLVVDRLPRLQSSAYPRRPCSASSRSCRM